MLKFFKKNIKANTKNLSIENLHDVKIEFRFSSLMNQEIVLDKKAQHIKVSKEKDTVFIRPQKDCDFSGGKITFFNPTFENLYFTKVKNFCIPDFFCSTFKSIFMDDSKGRIIKFRATDFLLDLDQSNLHINNILTTCFNLNSKYSSGIILDEGGIHLLNINNIGVTEIKGGRNFFNKTLNVKNTDERSIKDGLLYGSINVTNLFEGDIKQGKLYIIGSPTTKTRDSSKHYSISPDFHVQRFKEKGKFEIHENILRDIKNKCCKKADFLLKEDQRMRAMFSIEESIRYAQLLKENKNEKHVEYSVEHFKSLLAKDHEKNMKNIKSKARENRKYKKISNNITNQLEKFLASAEMEKEIALLKERMNKEMEEAKEEEEARSQSVSERDRIAFLDILSSDFPTDSINQQNRNKMILFLKEINPFGLSEKQQTNIENLKLIYNLSDSDVFRF